MKNITGIDKSYFCTMFNMMVDADRILIDNGKAARCKHRALTGMLRYKWVRYIGRLKKTVYNCDVLPYLGALPPELRAQLPKNKIASVTAQFRENLENFLIANDTSREKRKKIIDAYAASIILDTFLKSKKG